MISWRCYMRKAPLSVRRGFLVVDRPIKIFNKNLYWPADNE